MHEYTFLFSFFLKFTRKIQFFFFFFSSDWKEIFCKNKHSGFIKKNSLFFVQVIFVNSKTDKVLLVLKKFRQIKSFGGKKANILQNKGLHTANITLWTWTNSTPLSQQIVTSKNSLSSRNSRKIVLMFDSKSSVTRYIAKGIFFDKTVKNGVECMNFGQNDAVGTSETFLWRCELGKSFIIGDLKRLNIVSQKSHFILKFVYLQVTEDRVVLELWEGEA